MLTTTLLRPMTNCLRAFSPALCGINSSIRGGGSKIMKTTGIHLNVPMVSYFSSFIGGGGGEIQAQLKMDTTRGLYDSSLQYQSSNTLCHIPSIVKVIKVEKKKEEDTRLVVQFLRILEAMNRNNRKPKRANHGARPCSNFGRRKRAKRFGNTNRGRG